MKGRHSCKKVKVIAQPFFVCTQATHRRRLASIAKADKFANRRTKKITKKLSAKAWMKVSGKRLLQR
jgi:hypothetical protein